MSYRYIRNMSLVIVVALLDALLFGCNRAGLNAPKADAADTQAAGVVGAAAPTTAPVAETTIVIDNFTFKPATVTIAPGTKVTWVNHDDVPHTATSSVKPRAFNSGTLDTDEKFSFTFTSPGTYPYFCAVHPHMTGQVVVK